MVKVSFRKILFLAAMMLPLFALRAQNTSDTIGSGTASSIYSAMPGAYGYHLSAAMYLANEINHSPGDIESLSFHITYGNYPIDDADKHVKIYLLETTASNLDLTQSWSALTSSATLVYDSIGLDIQWDDYWKEFLFSQSFYYAGGNLIVLVEGEACDPNPGMGDCETEIYVNNGTVNNCWNRVQDGTPISVTDSLSTIPAGTHGNHYDRPNIVFAFSNGSPTTQDSNCVLTLPSFENFENYPGDFSSVPSCWTKISQEYNSSYGSYYPVINGGSVSDPNQSVMFMLMDSYSEYLVLPALDGNLSMQNISMSFKYKSTQQSTVKMVIGVMTDPADTLTFVPVDTVWRENSVSGWENKEVNFALYADTGRHVAFWFSKANSSFLFPSCFIDEVSVFETPNCTPPVQISSSLAGLDATISWAYTNNAAGARLYYKAGTDAEYDSVEVYGDNFYTLYGLPYNTTYQYYLVTVCDDNSESAASAVFSFSTPCESVTEFPWADSFENGIGCWTLNASISHQNWQPVSAGTYPTCMPYEGAGMLKYDCWSYPSGSWGTMASPALVLTDTMQLSFKYYKQDLYPAQDMIEVYVNNTPNLTGDATLLATVYGYDPVESGWDSVTVTLPAQSAETYVIFKAISDYGYNLFMDLVTVDYYIPVDTTELVDTVYEVLTMSICEGESVELAGTTYTGSGTYTVSSNDTVYTLTLTVNPTYQITINDSIAEGQTYTQYGFNENAAGTYMQNLATVHGCDSVIVLNLTIIQEEQPVYVMVDTAVCEGESVELAGNSYTDPGTYTVTTTDTVYTLTLTVNPVYAVTITDSITAGETYTQYGFNESAAGTYTQNLTTVNGCDSIITLNLTVLTGVRVFDGTEIMLSPNPAHDYVVLTMNGARREEMVVDLLDISGRVLRTLRMPVTESSVRIERGNLPNGIYMLRMTVKEQMQTRKLIFR